MLHIRFNGLMVAANWRSFRPNPNIPNMLGDTSGAVSAFDCGDWGAYIGANQA